MIKILKRDLRKEIVEIQDEEGNIVPQEQKVIPSIEYKSIEETDSSIVLLFGFSNNGVKEEKKLLFYLNEQLVYETEDIFRHLPGQLGMMNNHASGIFRNYHFINLEIKEGARSKL